MILITCEDNDDTYSLTEKLSYQTTHDEFTGLAKRSKNAAEFVEDSDVLAVLRSVGVNYAQGFEIDRPMPIDQFSSIA